MTCGKRVQYIFVKIDLFKTFLCVNISTYPYTMETPPITARVSIPELHTPEPFDCSLSLEQIRILEDRQTIQSILAQSIQSPYDSSMNSREGFSDRESPEDDESTESTESIPTQPDNVEPTERNQNNDTRSVYSEDFCEGDPPIPEESSIETLVSMLCTMNIKEMEEYGAEYRIYFNYSYDVEEGATPYTHIMLTTDYVWLNIQNTFAGEMLPRFQVREIRYAQCAQYLVDCIFDGDMRYTAYPNGSTSYWVRLDMRPMRLMRKFLQETRRGIDSEDRDLISFMESLVDDLLDAIARDSPLNLYIRRVFIPQRR